MKLYYSYGWKKPYCFTVKDNYSYANKECIVDGGFYHYNISSPWQHIKWLSQYDFKFIMGFDYCPKDKATRYLKTLKEKGKEVAPIVHDINSLYEVPVETDYIATDCLDVLKDKNGYQVHWLGSLPSHLYGKIDTADINPYENSKDFLLENIRKAKDYPINLPEKTKRLGEFMLYGSSLFINNPQDYDLLYYGNYTEEEIKETLPSNKKFSICKVTEEEIEKPGITHILFGFENGVEITPCPHIRSIYKKAKENLPNIKHKVIGNKNFIAFRYMRNLDPIKEFKTLLVANHYINQSELTLFLYNRLHLLYRYLQTADRKAHLLLDRELHSRFGIALQPNLTMKHEIYKKKDIQTAYQSFFRPTSNILIDEEQIQIKLA